MKNLFQDYSDKIAEFGVHDPAIIKTKGKYYTISTHGYFQIRESNDLIHWFDNKNSCFNQTTIQNELKEGIEYCQVEVPKSRNLDSPFWAPDIIKIGSKYFLYYSISSFGSTQSFIGLAKSDNILGPYKNQGKIISSKSGGNIELPNAIDPCVKFDKDKKLWLSYGSFFGGIYIIELNKTSGLSKNNKIGTHIAGGKMAPIEGSFITYNKKTDYYYLFLSFGSLVDSYNVRVARSKNIFGPYLDPNGKIMTDTDWDNLGGIIIANYRFLHQKHTYTAPGHNSILQDGEKFYFVHHTRLDEKADKHYLNIRSMYFNELDWPVVMSNRYAHDKLYLSNKNINGTYNVIHLSKRTSTKTNESISIEIQLNRNLTKHKQYIQFFTNDKIYYGVMASIYDEGLNMYTLAFSAMSKDGETIYAIKIK